MAASTPPSATAAIASFAKPTRNFPPTSRSRWPNTSLDAPLVPAFTGRPKILAVDLGWRELHGFATPAGRDLVRVVEDELSLHLFGLVVHFGAEQVQHRLGVDQNL